MEASIVVALITGGFMVIVALINKFRHDNHDDHQTVMDTLQQVHQEVRDVGGKIDRHIEWHVEGGKNVGITARDKTTKTRTTQKQD